MDNKENNNNTSTGKEMNFVVDKSASAQSSSPNQSRYFQHLYRLSQLHVQSSEQTSNYSEVIQENNLRPPPLKIKSHPKTSKD